jgi:ABC-type glycerol-3-phosphate transport system substrate-binding protein
MKAKLNVAVCIAVLSVALAACAPVATPASPPLSAASPGSTMTQPPEPTATAPQPGVTAAPGALKIQFWHEFGTMQGVAMQRLADKFNAANPSIYIVPTQQGSSDTELYRKMNAAIAANSYPDLVWGRPADLMTYYSAGVVAPLDPYINDPKDGLSAAQMAEINTPLYFTKHNGETLFVAAAVMEQIMYYNADMLKATGFAGPPKTWDEFDKVCAAVSKPPDTYCYAFIPNASTFASWVWSRGGEYTTADEKAAVFDDSAGIETLKWLKNQSDKHWGYQPAGAYGDTTDFGNGKTAFTFSMSSGLPYYSDAVDGSKKPFKWGIAPFPAGLNGKQVVNSYNTSMAILKTTPEKQKAAWLWIKFMLSEEGGTNWALATAYFPTTKSTLNALNAMDATAAQSANPDFAKILEQYKSATGFASFGRAEPISPAWQGARTGIENMMIAVFTGKSGADFQATDPAAAAREGVQRVNDALSQYGK